MKTTRTCRIKQPVIPATKNAIADETIYLLIARWSLWNFFDRVWAQTLGPLPHPTLGPFIFYLNHSSWWDGYLMMLIHRTILERRFDSYVMMEEQQLRSFRFFTWCGAFSINSRSPDEVLRVINYSSCLLCGRSNRAIYMFPQGRIVPNDQRPLVTYPGIAWIVKKVGAVTLCPITLRYEFRGEQRPDVFVRLGPSHRVGATDVNNTALTAEVTARLTASLDALRDAVIADDISQFYVILRGRPGINRVFEGIMKVFQPQRLR